MICDSETRKQIKECLIGETLQSAKSQAEAAGWFIRVMRDGKSRMVGTADFRPNRIDVGIDDGHVTEIF